MQNTIETVVNFVKDEVAKPNLGHKYPRYLPLLLTIFFFILINNIFGLIPGSANVTGNIAFTLVLSLISFVVIMFSTNKHYWAHILTRQYRWGKTNSCAGGDTGCVYQAICLDDKVVCQYGGGSHSYHLPDLLIFILGALNQYVELDLHPCLSGLLCLFILLKY